MPTKKIIGAFAIVIFLVAQPALAANIYLQPDHSSQNCSYGQGTWYNGLNFTAIGSDTATTIKADYYSSASGVSATGGAFIYDTTTGSQWSATLDSATIAGIDGGSMTHVVYTATLSSGTGAVNSGDNLYVGYASNVPGGNSGCAASDSSGNVYLQLISNPAPDDTSTRIITVSPVDGATVATSTSGTLEWTGYVNASDFDASTTQLRVSYTEPGLATGGFSILQAWDAFTQSRYKYFPISASGSFDISTTTDWSDIGQRSMNVSIVAPGLSLFGFSITTNVLAATSTTFTVGTSSALDIAYGAYAAAGLDLASTTAAAVQVSDACSIFSFDLATCISSILFPTSQDLSSSFQQFHDEILSLFPLGYVTRVGDYVTDYQGMDASSSIPDLVLPLPVGFPGAGTSFTLALNGNLWSGDGGTSTLDEATDTLSGSGKTIQDITEFGWDAICYAVFGLAIVMQIFGVHLPSRSKNEVQHHGTYNNKSHRV